MKRKILKAWLLAALSAIAASAQAGWPWTKGGENAQYGIWVNVPRSLEDGRVSRPGNTKGFLAANFGLRYKGYFSERPPPVWGGYQRMADTGHRIPEDVDVSWREMPPPGADPYTGELQGPYRIRVRSRIPPEVLEQAGKRGFIIQMLFSVGKLPILFNWRLVDYDLDNPTGSIKILRQGGDSYE